MEGHTTTKLTTTICPDLTVMICALVRECLMQEHQTLATERRLRTINFFIDEFSIRALEKAHCYEC